MATPTKEELQAMANAMLAMDKKLIADVEAAMTGFETSIKNLLAALPDAPSPNTAAFLFAQRVRTMLSSNTQYELQTLKAQYGLSGTTPAPTTTP